MAITEPFEIYVERIEQDVEDMKEIEDKLRNLVGYGLGMDTNLIPKRLRKESQKLLVDGLSKPAPSGIHQEEEQGLEGDLKEQDMTGGNGDGQSDVIVEKEDRFTVMSLGEAKRIQRLIAIGIGIELGIDIIMKIARS
ncbi:hypothetical protein H4Q26_011260 [Puccinia striiformis f. sp. tritici PST-130]|nr:hypothetical protein H4Q26_011260 [Puccinia striiformis f. sp. tritici PST-130]